MKSIKASKYVKADERKGNNQNTHAPCQGGNLSKIEPVGQFDSRWGYADESKSKLPGKSAGA